MKKAAYLFIALLLLVLPAIGGCGNSGEHKQLLILREKEQLSLKETEDVLKSLPDELERNVKLKKELKALETRKAELETRLKSKKK